MRTLYSTVTDCFLVMLLPLQLVFKVQLPISRKISIAGLFCLGLICIIAATFRVTQIGERDSRPTIQWLAFWSSIESSVGTLIERIHRPRQV
jgi:hypothetical protein